MVRRVRRPEPVERIPDTVAVVSHERKPQHCQVHDEVVELACHCLVNNHLCLIEATKVQVHVCDIAVGVSLVRVKFQCGQGFVDGLRAITKPPHCQPEIDCGRRISWIGLPPARVDLDQGRKVALDDLGVASLDVEPFTFAGSIAQSIRPRQIFAGRCHLPLIVVGRPKPGIRQSEIRIELHSTFQQGNSRTIVALVA